MSRLRRILRPLGLPLALAALSVGGLLVGVRLAGPADHATALGSVEITVTPAWDGGVDAFVPLANWGVRAEPFEAPVRLEVEPRAVDRQAMVRAADGDSELLRRTKADLEEAVGDAIKRALLFGLAGGLAGGLMWSLLAATRGRRRRVLLAGPLVAVALAGAVGGVTAWRIEASADVNAFDRPTFYARGAELLQLVQVSQQAREATGQYESQVERTLRGYAALLAEGVSFDAPDSRGALLVSDLHDNIPALGALDGLAGDEPVFFAGDFGQDGGESDQRLLPRRVAELGSRVIAVSGNHDSRQLMRELARRGVTVLTGRGTLRPDGNIEPDPVIDVEGLTVAGVSDPLEWQGENPSDPARIFSFSERPDGEREHADAQRRLVAWYDSLPERPDVVMVHQNGLADHLARTVAARPGAPPLIVLTGHDHRQHLERYGPVTLVDGGTAGAGGIFGAGKQRIGLADLHFDAAGALQAVDLINVEPLSGAAQAERVPIDARSPP